MTASIPGQLVFGTASNLEFGLVWALGAAGVLVGQPIDGIHECMVYGMSRKYDVS